MKHRKQPADFLDGIFTDAEVKDILAKEDLRIAMVNYLNQHPNRFADLGIYSGKGTYLTENGITRRIK